jgi:hypothetical protein
MAKVFTCEREGFVIRGHQPRLAGAFESLTAHSVRSLDALARIPDRALRLGWWFRAIGFRSLPVRHFRIRGLVRRCRVLWGARPGAGDFPGGRLVFACRHRSSLVAVTCTQLRRGLGIS